jgi:hypothetical protein
MKTRNPYPLRHFLGVMIVKNLVVMLNLFQHPFINFQNLGWADMGPETSSG